jgi:hypothetical protein
MLSINEIEKIVEDNYHYYTVLENEHPETYQKINSIDGNTFAEKVFVYMYGEKECEYEDCDNRASFKSLNKGFKKYCSKQCNGKSNRKESEVEIIESPTKDDIRKLINENRYYEKSLKKKCPDEYSKIDKEIEGDSFSEKLYVYLNEESKCKYSKCDNRSNFISFKQGFGNYCSTKCRGKAKSENAEITRECKNCGKEFSFNQNKDKSFCSYSCSNSYNELVEERVEKSMKTQKEKYGGVGYASKELLRKTRKTLEQKYNDNWYTNREKFKKTIEEKYGGMKGDSEFQQKLQQGRLKTFFPKLQSRLRKKKNLKLQVDIEEYDGLQKEYPIKCLECEHKFHSKVRSQPLPSCPKCSPQSKPEQKLYEFVNKLVDCKVVQNDQSVLDGKKELDIFIPEKKIAIEYDGIIWHSELFGNKDKKYHLNKTKACENQDVQLLHVFGHEWQNKRNITKSTIAHKLNESNTETVYARNCNVIEVPVPKKTQFLNENHLQGTDRSKVKMGLTHNNDLVAVMTFSRPKLSHGPKNGWELSRFASSKFVVGGASRLLTHFQRDHNPEMIYTYANRRWSKKNESMYTKIGFDFVHETDPNYWYFQPESPNNLHHRFGFRKSKLKDKLEDFDPDLTEWENMVLHGWDRVWDCGHLKFELT